MLEIHTDGGCRNNPGVGAWAFIVTEGNTILHQASGAVPDTTNNVMELTAVLRTVEWLNVNHPGQAASIRSDSQYVVNSVNLWYSQWKSNGTLGSKKNVPLIGAIVDAKGPGVTLSWVKGHAGNYLNDLADTLVNRAVERFLGIAEISDELAPYLP